MQQQQQPHQSEVARLLSRISDEYEAARRGLTGLSQGTSQHDFINARMEGMMRQQKELAGLVGAKQANQMVADHLDR